MQVGDLVRALIIEDRPMGIIIAIQKSSRFQRLYYVWTENGQIGSFPFREHQLELVSANR